MNLIIALSIIVGPTFANASKGLGVVVEAYSSKKSSGYFVASKNYEDLRVMDRQGQLKYWIIQYKNLRVEQFFKKGQLEKLNALETSGNLVKEVNYQNLKGKLILSKAILRPKKQMAGAIIRGDDPNAMCTTRKNLLEEFNGISKTISAEKCEENIESKLVSSECKTVFSPSQYQHLLEAYAVNLILPDERNKVLLCLNNPETLNVFAKSCNIKNTEELKTELDIVSLRFKMKAAKLSQEPELVASDVTCDKNLKKTVSAVTDDTGKTTFFNSAQPQSFTSKDMEKLVFDELLHGAGIQDQGIVTSLINICYEKANTVECNLAKNEKFAARKILAEAESVGHLMREKDHVENIASKAAAGIDAKITTKDLSAAVPQTLAKVEGPSPQAVASEAVASSQAYVRNTSMTGETSEGQKQAILKSSFAMTQGPLNTASRIMKMAGGSVPAAIANPSMAVAAPKFERLPASQRAVASKVGSSPGAANSVSASATSLAQENVESLSADSAVGSVTDTPKGRAAPRGPASELGTGQASGAGGSGARSGAGGSAGSIGSAGSAGQGSRSENSPKRAVASAAARAEQLRIAQMLQADYRKAQSQLAKGEFRRLLEENNITVLKLDGSPAIGAPKGDVILLDNPKEGKIVRQK